MTTAMSGKIISAKRKVLGFTLLELLVVMTIAGILAAVGIVSYGTVQVKARDAKRKNDLESIARALEMYRNDFGRYPESVDGKISLVSGVGLEWGAAFVDDEIYMQQLPVDKRNGYVYQVDNTLPKGQWYRLFARLENTEDVAVATDQTNPGVPQRYVPIDGTPPLDGDSCKEGCNYYLGSTNATLPAMEAD